jgi:predicted ATPase/class 3 adenylate cyclase
MHGLPSGTVTILLTDIEGSTDLLQRLGDTRYAGVLAEHRGLLRAACAQEGGREIGTQGDGVLMAFPRARDAVAAAVAAQRAIHKHAWDEGMAPRVRMGLHTGEPGSVEGEYVGLDLHRAARICAAAYGGQILVSLATSVLIEGSLPPEVELRSLGEHRLRDLKQPERIFQVLHPDLPSEFPPLRSRNVVPNNLPQQLTSFIGREREIFLVKQLLSSTPILTVTGSGGCGKTRLALHVAGDQIEAYADGVWLVELAALAEPRLVLSTVASVLGLREAPGRALLAIVLDYLRTKKVLLVLDNCEHLVAACAEVAEAFVRSCPRLRILVTSREPLGIQGETVWRVPSLSLPDTREVRSVDQLMQYEATRLFVERATAVHWAFTVTPHTADSIVEVCRRLGGIPLAIELAAARMRALSVEQIAARLNERFSFLTGGSRTLLPRQQTLRGALDWSYDLLSDKERRLLCRLSVFAGAWTLEAAEGVCTGDGIEPREILDLLTQLVFKSLVLMEGQEGEAWYHLLETVRHYGHDKLDESGETAGVRTRHLNWYLRLSELAEPELTGADQGVWLDRLEREHDNLRTALEWSTAHEGGREAGLRLASALWQFWHVRGHFGEGRGWLETLLTDDHNPSAPTRAKALVGAGFLASRQGDYHAAIRLCTESLNVFRQLDNPSGMAQAVYGLGMVAESQGDYERAKTFLMESLTLARQAGGKRRAAVSLNSLGEVGRCQGDYSAAQASYEESLALLRELGDKRSIAITLGNLGHVALYQGECERAAVLFSEALGLTRQLMFRLGIAEYLAGLGGVAAAEGGHLRAARLLGAAEEMLRLLGALLRPPDLAEYERSIATTRAELTEEAFRTAWDEGRAMTVDQAIGYALGTDTLNFFHADGPEDRTRRPSSR